jgi:hypothetical protein
VLLNDFPSLGVTVTENEVNLMSYMSIYIKDRVESNNTNTNIV